MSYNLNKGTTYATTNFNNTRTVRENISAANRDANNRSQDLDAIDRVTNAQANRTVETAGKLASINRFDNTINYDRQRELNKEDRDFRSSESRSERSQANEQFNKKINQEQLDRAAKTSQSDADREKSKQEFKQNNNLELLRMQVQGNKEKGDAALELTKSYRDQGFKEASERQVAQNQQNLASINNAAQEKLANIAQQTALGDQSASIKRAQENAKAQVSAALYGSSRQYAGY